MVQLLTLSALKRVRAGIRAPTAIGEAIEIYRRSIRLAPGFIWVTILQLLAPAAGLFIFELLSGYMPRSIGVWAYIALVLMILLGALVTILVFAWRDVEEIEIPAAEVARFDREHRAEPAQ